jgi:hypothetical protein
MREYLDTDETFQDEVGDPCQFGAGAGHVGLSLSVDWHNILDQPADIGRCTECNGVHVKCYTCGVVLAVPKAAFETELRCGCRDRALRLMPGKGSTSHRVEVIRTAKPKGRWVWRLG